jgi:hypothetical protein
MLRKTLSGAAASIALLLPQLSYGAGGGMGDVADAMRRSAAAYATDPAQRCPNIAGSQYWFLEFPPNCTPVADQTAR